MFKKIKTTQMTENELSKIVFEIGLKIHKNLGPIYLKLFTKNACFMN